MANRRYVWLLFALLFLGGCVGRQPEASRVRAERLGLELRSMDKSVDKNEAETLAREAISYSLELARRYKVQTTPWIHNFFVNVGLKKRGLCYQWADDLLTHLTQLHSKSLKLLPIGANIGDYWKEHNAIVVLPARVRIPLSQGVLLDAWRHSGYLYFSIVGKDTKYKWRVRTERLHVVKQ